MTSEERQKNIKRAELHTHLGSSVAPSSLWAIAHDEGIRLPMKNYWEFEKMVTMSSGEKNKSLDDMHNNFFRWTELIQSSPIAVSQSVRSVISGGYRKCNLVLQELRFNPMFRNRQGERDLDHIITAAIHGMEKAMLDYPQVKAGLIVMMDRTLTFEQNEIILNKAIKYKTRGIIGIDIAGPQSNKFSMKKTAVLFKKAKEAGLGVTIHSGEEGELEELEYVVNEINPDRIGHGILAVKSEKLMQKIVDNNIILELCPTSNLLNNKIDTIDNLRNIIKTLFNFGIKITINTDGPEMYRTNVMKEEDFLLENKVLTDKEIQRCRENAFNATFIK